MSDVDLTRVEADAARLERFAVNDLERLGHGRGIVRAFLRKRCVADGFRPGSRGLPISLWRVRERAA